MFLDQIASMSERLLLKSGGCKVKNVGLIMALIIRFARKMRQCDLLRPQQELFRDSSRFDYYIRDYAEENSIEIDRLDGLEPLTRRNDFDGMRRDADCEVFRKVASYYANRWGCRPCEYPRLEIGGDRCDLTTWSSVERETHSRNGEDPLKKEDIDALKSGKTMQVT